jgi:hypothetical protein
VTLLERAESYARAFAKFPASHLRLVRERGGECLYGTWLIGNDYRNKTRYYGAYPAGFLPRVEALFPDAEGDVLHAFSGSLPAGNYTRCDVNPANGAELVCDVLELPSVITHGGYRLVVADPPYSKADATKYATPMVNRGKATRALAGVTMPGGFLVWLDTVWPMFSGRLWRTVGRICLVRSTNHRVRMVTIFERVAG